jgi:hypothetical protein
MRVGISAYAKPGNFLAQKGRYSGTLVTVESTLTWGDGNFGVIVCCCCFLQDGQASMAWRLLEKGSRLEDSLIGLPVRAR